MTRNKQKEFMIAMIVFAIACFFRFFQRTMEYQNTTLFAFSYKYGFISRGFMGSLYACLDRLLPLGLMNYKAVYYFNIIATVIYFAIGLWFCSFCLNRTKAMFDDTKYLVILYGIYTFTMYLTEENFGRLDLYLTIITIISLLLILKDKYIWLVPILAAICVLIHQGYVFTHVNILLVVLLYRAICSTETKIASSNEKIQRNEYAAVFIVTMIVVSILFIYFEFFSHSKGEQIYDSLVTSAMALSESGKDYNVSLVNHEILGQGVFKDEWEYHVANYMEFPCYILIYIPFIIIGVDFLKNLFRNTKARLKYIIILLGPLTLLPQMILKVDYGRYMYLISSYVITIMLCLYVLKDESVIQAFAKTKEKIKKILPIPQVLLIYLLFLMPHLDVLISWTSYRLSALIFNL